MGITSVFKGDFADNLRQIKQFYEWFRNTDVSLKELKKYDAASDTLRELAKISDIRKLKPVTGWKRKLQLDYVEAAKEVQRILDEEGITAFLYGGNLLGYVRHGGFIPWDDDFDYLILRNDYNRLLRYFEEKGSLLVVHGNNYEEDIKSIDEFCKEHMGQPVLVKFFDIAQFSIADNHVKRITVDFFPVDFIKESTDFSEYKKYIGDIMKEVQKIQRSEKESFIAEYEKKNPYSSDSPTSIICYGLDWIPNGWLNKKTGHFIPADYLFPFERDDFEGGEFVIPAKPADFMEMIYPGSDDYPGIYASGGAKAHEVLYAEWFVRHGTKAELLVHDEDEIKAFLPLYEKLRDNNVFAEFINCIKSDKWGYLLDKYEVRYSFRRNFDSAWAVTSGDLKELDRYRNKKLLFTGDTEGALKQILQG